MKGLPTKCGCCGVEITAETWTGAVCPLCKTPLCKRCSKQVCEDCEEDYTK